MTTLKSLAVENFVALHQRLEWCDHASLIVILRVEDTGKTHLLKLLYIMMRSIEDYLKKRSGPEAKELAELLSSKLRWTVLPQKMKRGQLITRGSDNRLSADLRWNGDGRLRFGFGRHITEIETEEIGELSGHKATILLPKEIPSIFDAIVATCEPQEIASFNETDYDWVRDFHQPTDRDEVEMQYHCSIMLRQGKESFKMHQTAEGIKKIGILSRLIRNRRLTPAGDCMLFIAEPEVNLHPKAIVLFVDMPHKFAQSGVQIHMTTHSFYILKRLKQLAHKHQTDYFLLDLRMQEADGVVGSVTRLSDSLPMNPIVEYSLGLYETDVSTGTLIAPPTFNPDADRAAA